MDEKVLKLNEGGGLMTVEQISQYMNIPRSHVYNLTMKDAIPHLHIGKLLRFRKDAVDNWLESQGATKE